MQSHSFRRSRESSCSRALPHENALLDDLAQILDSIHAKKRVLLGHSMGGAVAARFVADEVRNVDALILSSPAPKDLVTAREFAGLYHEIFNEREPAVLETMRDWLARTCW